VLEQFDDITKERECQTYKESENRIKYEEIAESIKRIFMQT